MSQAAYQVVPADATESEYKASAKRISEPYWGLTVKVLQRLQASSEAGENEDRVDAATADWAKEVLLRVLPRFFLVGAQIDTFKGEIHVSWESENKKIVVFFLPNLEIKIYREELNSGRVISHLLQAERQPFDVTAALQWYSRLTR